jgi:hypothetical protein
MKRRTHRRSALTKFADNHAITIIKVLSILLAVLLAAAVTYFFSTVRIGF